MSERTGSLVVVGLGLRAISDLTMETRQHLKNADRVFYLSSNLLEEKWICNEIPSARSLEDCYREGEERIFAYRRMAARVVESVEEGMNVCMALYGHPGLCCIPGHLAIETARIEGYPARMLPGISALDWLVADLGIDIATAGFQSYGATELVDRQPMINPVAYLVIWQAALTGERAFRMEFKPPRLEELQAFLLRTYSPTHPVVVYEAAVHALASPTIERIALSQLTPDAFTLARTMVLPPNLHSATQK